MAKKNNKGFALVEIIIAVAIMTILLTPIIKQLTQTLQLNRRAKVQQYASENAEYVLEYFKASSLVDLESLSTDEMKTTAFTSFKEATMKKCRLYLLDTTTNDLTDTGEDILYNAYEYTLDSVKLGSDRVEYERSVIMDDLEKRINEKKIPSKPNYIYAMVNYNNDVINDYKGLGKDDFGAVLERDDAGFVTKIACKQIPGTSNTNPNTANLGNMFDIDIDNMAVVNGESVEFDAIAQQDFYSETMRCLKNSPIQEDVDRYKDELAASEPGTVVTPDLYMEGMNKLTMISVQDTGESYVISFDVKYENFITAGGTGGTKVTKDYNIKTLEYKYDTSKDVPKCPDIYFEYQPFSIMEEGSLRYTVNDKLSDYILFNSEVEGVKMYLIKPDWDHAAVYFNGGVSSPYASGVSELYTGVTSENKYYVRYTYNPPAVEGGTPTTSHGNLAKICLANVDGTEQVSVFTNINIDTSSDVAINNITNPARFNAQSQFKTSYVEVYDTVFLDNSGNKIPVEPFKFAEKMIDGSYDLDNAYLSPLEKDKNSREKLYSIRVKLKPVDDVYNTVVLSGAKGVN